MGGAKGFTKGCELGPLMGAGLVPGAWQSLVFVTVLVLLVGCSASVFPLLLSWPSLASSQAPKRYDTEGNLVLAWDLGCSTTKGSLPAHSFH